MFLPAMRDFQAQATCRLAEAEDLFQDMKTRVSFDTFTFETSLDFLYIREIYLLSTVRSSSKIVRRRFGRRATGRVLRDIRELSASVSRGEARRGEYEEEDRGGRA